jgi:antitoxin ParD1/3/4
VIFQRLAGQGTHRARHSKRPTIPRKDAAKYQKLTILYMRGILGKAKEVRMAQMNVSIPDPMKDWCEAQIREGRYSTASDYIRDLIRRDQDMQSGVKALQAAIADGLASGVSPRSLDEIMTEARKRGKALGTDGC